jgi:DNA-binding NarL/FixJ family response regulator
MKGGGVLGHGAGMADDIREGSDRGPASDGLLTCAIIGFDQLVRDLIGSMLRLRRGLRILVQAEGLETAGDIEARALPDILVVDGAGLSPSALFDLELALATRPDVRVVVIAPTTRNATRPDWIRAQAYVVVGHDESFEILLERLESLFPELLAETALAGGSPTRHRPLTDREAEVVALMGEGLTTTEIARRLGRSVHTIQTHRKRIGEKLGRLGSALHWRVVGHRETYFRGHERLRT